MSANVLTIDGPAGSGKGSVARAIAKKLGWHYLDSGAIYRALAIAVISKGVRLDNEAAIVATADALQLEFANNETFAVHVNGEDVSDRIGSEQVGDAASIISALPGVRAALLAKQLDFRRAPGLVTDGRDMGTVVFPDAIAKVYLTASLGERARRRYLQLDAAGKHEGLAKLTREMLGRDERDSSRKNAPLAMAIDALYIDSTSLSLDGVVGIVLGHALNKAGDKIDLIMV